MFVWNLEMCRELSKFQEDQLIRQDDRGGLAEEE
jgi:hypothetical protein